MGTFNEIAIKSWKRKAQYEFFKDYEDPFFNITADVEIGNLLSFVKRNQLSFNLSFLFYSQKVIQSIPEFKTRIEGDKVLEYERIHCGSTILMPDQTFSYCYFAYSDDVFEFNKLGRESINQLILHKDFNPREGEADIIHYSSIPWISFNSIKHPRKFGKNDSIPKIVFGKYRMSEGKLVLPVSVEAHHALMDGYHLGLYFDGLKDEFQGLT